MIYVIFLKFGPNKSQAPNFMEGHVEWLRENTDNGTFLMYGSLNPQQGGAIIATGSSYENIEQLVSEDPFVVEGIVHAEINEVSLNGASEALSFLLDVPS